MKLNKLTDGLAGLGGAKWDLHFRARSLAAQGKDIIELTIGEPDIATPRELIEAADHAMKNGRTHYADARGEPKLRDALASRYSTTTGRKIHRDQILCFPGTQTALFAVMMGIAEAGDEVLVGDPMYATYEGVIRSSGATMVPVPLHPANGFRLQCADIAERITAKTRALLVTNPHNPTGAVLTNSDIAQIGKLARQHGFWIVCDEVYEALLFEGQSFASPLFHGDLADRVVVVSSISKSHAAPGFRSGWCVGSRAFTGALLPLVESMLFGNQPFIADMTETSIRNGSPVAALMRERFASRARLLASTLGQKNGLVVHPPQAGMFAMVDITATGMNGHDYAVDLLEKTGVAVRPGSSFGDTMRNWIRVSLTVDDEPFLTACQKMARHAQQIIATGGG